MRFYRNKEDKGRVRKRWIDLVDPVVALYNQSPHRSLDNHSPLFATKSVNWDTIFALYGKKRYAADRRQNYFRRGTHVRIRLKGGSFGIRASEQKNSEEIFTIASIHSSLISFLILIHLIRCFYQLDQ